MHTTTNISFISKERQLAYGDYLRTWFEQCTEDAKIKQIFKRFGENTFVGVTCASEGNENLCVRVYNQVAADQ